MPRSEHGGAMQEKVTYSLQQAARAYRVRSARMLARIGLYPGQDALLKLLENGPKTMGEAAALLAIQPPTVTKMVSRLSAAGLVQTEVLDRDRRKVAISVTDAARDRLEQIELIWDALEQQALDGIDAQSLKDGLAAVTRNLSKPERNETESP